MTICHSFQSICKHLKAGTFCVAVLASLLLTLRSEAQEFTYTLSEEGIATITSYYGTATAITIPTTIDNFPVRAIGDDAFQFNSTLTSVVIPSGIVSIGERSFIGCSGLTSTNIPNSVTSVGNDAFRECTDLATVVMGSGVSSLGTGVFASCSNLTSITAAVANLSYSSLSGVLFDESKATLIQYPPKKAGPYTIPSTVTTIGPYAFGGSITGFTSLILPPGLTTIGAYAFNDCTFLTSIAIPNSVATIGTFAFNNCTGITNISIGNGVNNVGRAAFYGCYGLNEITVDPLNLFYSSLDGVLFNEAQTTLIQYPARKTGRYLVPNGVIAIERDAFDTAIDLTSVNLPSGLATIGDSAFYGCSALTSIVIPSSITRILDYTFAECTKLTSITVGNGVTEIGNYAFSGCVRVTGATFGTGLSSIGNNAFENCSLLSRATFSGNAPTLGVSAFSAVAAGFTVTYPTLASGFTTPPWDGYTSAPTSIAPPEISVEQPALTLLNTGTSTVTFAPTLVNSTRINTFTIRNLGSAILQDIIASKDGPNASEFTISSVATSVNGAANTTFTVTFQPAAAGTRTAVLHLSSNDLDENPFVIALTGQGTGPDIAVEQLPNNTPLSDGVSTVPFDIVPINTTKVLSFTIRNSGTTNLTSLAITKSGTHNTEFTVGGLGATTLAPGISTSFTISFRPTAVGARTAAISIASNVVGAKNPFSINLSGGIPSDARLSALTINSGILAPVFSSDTNTYTTNVDSATANISVTPTVLVAGATVRVNGGLVASGIPSASIPLVTGATTIHTVVTAPDGVTTRTYALIVTKTDSYGSWASSQGLGPGNSAKFDNPDNDGSVNLLEYAFGTDPLSGQSGSLILNGNTIIQHGTPISQISPGPIYSGVFIRRADYLTAGLIYKPQFSSNMIDWIDAIDVPEVIATNGIVEAVSVPYPEGKTFFRVSVTCVAPDIALELLPGNTPLIDDVSTVPWDIVPLNTTKVLSFRVTNSGTSSLTGLAITKSGTNNAEFTTSALGATTLAVGDSTTFTISFSPTAVGSRTASISIASNVVGTKSPFTINLNGGVSSDARLAALSINTGVLAPAFSSDTNQYTSSVDSSIAAVSLSPTIFAAGGTVRVNGTLVTSGTPSAAIPLVIGANAINTVVTAPDGVTTRTYSLIVTKIDPYGSWASSQGLVPENSAKFDNPDNDGSVNLLEYAFGTDPLSGQSGSLILNGNTIIQHGTPISQISPGPIYSGVFIRRADYLTAGLIYKPQFSSNMIDWSDSTDIPTVLADDGVVQAVSVPYPADKTFFRVSVSLP